MTDIKTYKSSKLKEGRLQNLEETLQMLCYSKQNKKVQYLCSFSYTDH